MTMHAHAMTRRMALQSLAAFCAALALPAHSNSEGACAFIAGLDQEGLRALGREYLKAHPQDEDIEDVRRMVRTSEAVADLSRCVRADYEAGRIVHLDGWFLSRTEGRFCAAVASC